MGVGTEVGDYGQPENSGYMKHDRSKDQEMGKEEGIRRIRANLVLFSIPAVLAFCPTIESHLRTIILE